MNKYLVKVQRNVRLPEIYVLEAEARGIPITDAAIHGLRQKLGYLTFNEAREIMFKALDAVEAAALNGGSVTAELAVCRQMLTRWQRSDGLKKHYGRFIEEKAGKTTQTKIEAASEGKGKVEV